MLQDELQEFQQEMREYQKHAMEAENKLTIQMHYNLEQTKQLIGADIYQPDQRKEEVIADKEDELLKTQRRFQKILDAHGKSREQLEQQIDRLRVELYDLATQNDNFRKENADLKAYIESIKDNVRVVEKVVTKTEFVPDPKVVEELK